MAHWEFVCWAEKRIAKGLTKTWWCLGFISWAQFVMQNDGFYLLPPPSACQHNSCRGCCAKVDRCRQPACVSLREYMSAYARLTLTLQVQSKLHCLKQTRLYKASLDKASLHGMQAFGWSIKLLQHSASEVELSKQICTKTVAISCTNTCRPYAALRRNVSWWWCWWWQ